MNCTKSSNVEQAVQAACGHAQRASTSEHGRTRPTSDGCPPLVIRGAKSHASVGVDWFRCTGDKRRLHEILTKLETLYGPFESKKGMYTYNGGRYQFANGAFIAFDEPCAERNSILVDLPGKAMQDLPDDEAALSLIRFLLFGMKCTRIDLRIDWQADQPVGMIDAVRESCEAKQLCRARVWEYRCPRSHTGLCLGKGVTIGKRGKDGSGRYTRAYDKGLETGELPEGRWERWEVEFSKDVATQVAITLVESTNWQQAL